MPKRYSAKLKFQIVMELIQGEKTAGEVAKAFGVHPNSASAWRRESLDKGPEVCAEDNTIQVHIPMKPTSDSGINQPPDLDNKTGQVIIHQVDDMVR